MKQRGSSYPFSVHCEHQPLRSLTKSALISDRENAVWNYIKSNCIIMVHENKCMSGWGTVQENHEQRGFHCWVVYLNPQSCPTPHTVLLNCKSTNDNAAGLFGSKPVETEADSSLLSKGSPGPLWMVACALQANSFPHGLISFLEAREVLKMNESFAGLPAPVLLPSINTPYSEKFASPIGSHTTHQLCWLENSRFSISAD